MMTWGDIRGTYPTPIAFFRGMNIVKVAAGAIFALALDGS